MTDPTSALKSVGTLRQRSTRRRVSFYKDYKFAEWGVNNHSCISVSGL